MRIGAAPGPGKEPTRHFTYVVYDVRSGDLVATHHVIGDEPAAGHIGELLRGAHEASRVPLDQLAILADPDLPAGEGAVHVDHAGKRLVRSGGGAAPRIRP